MRRSAKREVGAVMAQVRFR